MRYTGRMRTESGKVEGWQEGLGSITAGADGEVTGDKGW
jgi:hypothetical protein